MNEQATPKLVKSALRTIDLFKHFAEAKRPLSLAEIAQGMEAPKSSCYELIQTLAHVGFMLVLEDGKSYYPSRRLFDMAEQINSFNPIKLKIHDKLKGLRDQTGETVFVGRLQGKQAVFLEVFDGTHIIRYTANTGDFRSIHASALGKALLGGLDGPTRDKLIAGLKLTRYNENTIVEKETLKINIEECERRGFYSTRGEHLPDVMGIACPILIQGNLLAFGMAGPIPRMEKNLESYSLALIRVIEELG